MMRGRAPSPLEPARSGGASVANFDDLLSLPDPEWLVDGLVPAEGLSVFFGGPGSFKSFVVGSLALRGAAGVPWFGHATKPGFVVYVAAEGKAGLKGRVTAWWDAAGRPDISRMRWLPEAVNLSDRAQVQRVRRSLASLPQPPRVLVVDTMVARWSAATRMP